MRSFFFIIPLTGLALMTLVISGCKKSPGDVAKNSGIPPIYYDATMTLYEGGQPAAQTSYQSALKMCHPVHLLSSQEVAQLGKERRQLWFQGDIRVEREDKSLFDTNMGPNLACSFAPVNQTTIHWSDGKAAYVKGPDGSVEEEDAYLASSRGPHTVIIEKPQSDEANAATNTVLEKGLHTKRIGQDVVLGQPCNLFENMTSGKFCEWAGLGHGGTAVIQSYAAVDTLNLKGEPVNGAGMEVVLRHFTVGSALNPLDLKAPEGVKVTR